MSGPERTVMFVYNPGLAATLTGTGQHAGKAFTLGAGTFSIGRDATNDLPLATEPGVSKVHCKISLEDGHFVVTDQESRNGTLVNGQPVKRAALRSGDQLRICNAIFLFKQEGDPGLPEPPLPPPPPAPVPEEATSHVARKPAAARKAKAPPPPPRKRSAAPFFILGMILFFGAAGATLFVAGVFDEALGFKKPDKKPVAAVPDEPKPIDVPPQRGADTPPASADGTQGAHAGGTQAQAAGTPDKGATPDKGTQPEKAVLPETLEGTLSVSGGSAGGESVDVPHTLDRKVGSVMVKVGAHVRKGQALLQYEDVEASRKYATQRELYNQLKEVAEASNSPRAQKELESAKAEMDRAGAALSALRVAAPREGTVQKLVATVGSRGQKGEVAVVLGAAGSAPVVSAAVDVPAGLEARFKRGARVKVTVAGKDVDATVEKLDGARATLAFKDPPDAADGTAVTVRVPAR